MLASLDGKTEGEFFSLPECRSAAEEYGNLRSFYKCQATLNRSFLNDDLIDELSLVIAPVSGGDNDSVSVFESSDLTRGGMTAVYGCGLFQKDKLMKAPGPRIYKVSF